MKYNSLEAAETQILGAVINDPSLFWTYSPRLKDEFFNIYPHVWKAYKAAALEGNTINLITINKEMAGDHIEELSTLTSKIDFSVDFETWVSFLEDEDKKRKGVKILSGLNEIINKNEVEKIEPFLHNSLNDISSQGFKHLDMKDHVKDIITHIENIKAGNAVTGYPTGIGTLDKFTGGLQLGDLTIIAAETSQGKTTWTLNIAAHNAAIGNYVGIFSLEMSLRQLTARLLAIDTNIPSKDLLTGNVDLQYLNKKIDRILNNKILLDNTRNSALENIISKIRYFVAAYKCKLFFIDYLQLISFYKKGNSTEQNLADICRTLKNLAKENDISIVLLCQLNRDTGGNKTPTLSRLRGSGQIEEAADNVIFIVRPIPNGYGDPEQAEIILAKGRNCGIGNFAATFVGNIPTFRNE